MGCRTRPMAVVRRAFERDHLLDQADDRPERDGNSDPELPDEADQRADSSEPDTAGAASATDEPPVEPPVEAGPDEPEGVLRPDRTIVSE